jgi:hypothetical protein
VLDHKNHAEQKYGQGKVIQGIGTKILEPRGARGKQGGGTGRGGG